MKWIAALALTALLNFQGALAADAQGGSSLFGVWLVDITRLPIPPQARPKSVTITFSDEGAGRIRAKVEVVDPTGALRLAEGVTPLDGSPTPVKSNFEADVSATLMPRPEVLIMQLGRDGKPASSRVYTVSPDGSQMVETVAYFDQNGQPVLRKNYFSRAR